MENKFKKYMTMLAAGTFSFVTAYLASGSSIVRAMASATPTPTTSLATNCTDKTQSSCSSHTCSKGQKTCKWMSWKDGGSDKSGCKCDE